MKAPKGMNFAVLRAVSLLGESACGTAVREYLERSTRTQVLSAHVYKALGRLEDFGFVICIEKGQGIRGRGRPRHLYSVSKKGTEALATGASLYGMQMPQIDRASHGTPEEVAVTGSAKVG